MTGTICVYQINFSGGILMSNNYSNTNNSNNSNNSSKNTNSNSYSSYSDEQSKNKNSNKNSSNNSSSNSNKNNNNKNSSSQSNNYYIRSPLCRSICKLMWLFMGLNSYKLILVQGRNILGRGKVKLYYVPKLYIGF